ncbi:rhomboid family protein [Halomicrobium katesii]|uniref:hypothetical protein n=1 Tax=Halomicrobium katesii TaxID=437163 RepID=UPI000372818D|nr:hypothetical protein [Halomicrobium katesii]
MEWSNVLTPIPDTVDRRLVVDAGFLSLLAWILVGIHVLVPSSVQTQLAFDHGAFISWTLWTHTYVHAGWSHLLQNVGGFVAIAGVAYILCRVLDARRWFWVSTVAFLTVLPVLVSLSSYVLLGWFAPAATPVERGFSGVVAGFAGLIFVAFLVWVNREVGLAVTQAVGQMAVLLMLWELSVIYAGWINVRVTALVAFGIALSWVLLLRAVSVRDIWDRRQAWWTELWLAMGVGIVLLTVVVALFPADPVSDGTFTNIFAHGAGFVWGGIVAGGAWQGIRRWLKIGITHAVRS